MTPIRVLTLDHHPLMRAGIEAILRAQPDLDPVGVAAHQRELWPLLSATEPDIVLLGASEASIAPLLVLCVRIKRQPSAPRVVLHGGGGAPLAVAARLAGVDGTARVSGSAQELLSTIRVVASGRAALPPVAPETKAAAAAILHPTDLPIFAMGLAGTPQSDIAGTLGLRLDELTDRMCAIVARLIRAPAIA